MTRAGNPIRLESAVDMTPLVDVLLVLLILFFAIQPALQRDIDVGLAGSSAEPPGDRAILKVSVTPGPFYVFDDELLRDDQLERRLRAVIVDPADVLVVVYAEDDVRYGAVVAAIDMARAAGVDNIIVAP